MTESFKNPTGPWSHEGRFTVELAPDGAINGLPTGAVFDPDTRTITVEIGRAEPAIGGIQFYANDNPFFLPYDRICAVRGTNDALLWFNPGDER